MTIVAIRQQLHQYIDATDDKKIEALFTLLQSDIEAPYHFSDEEMRELHERAEKYLAGRSETYTVEESHNKIRGQRKTR